MVSILTDMFCLFCQRVTGMLTPSGGIYLSACNMCDGCRWPPSSCLGDTLWPLSRTLATSSLGGCRVLPCASPVWRHPGSADTLHPGVPVNRGWRRLHVRIKCLVKVTQIRTYEEEMLPVGEWCQHEEAALDRCSEREHLKVRYLAQGHLSSAPKGF